MINLRNFASEKLEAKALHQPILDPNGSSGREGFGIGYSYRCHLEPPPHHSRRTLESKMGIWIFGCTVMVKFFPHRWSVFLKLYYYSSLSDLKATLIAPFSTFSLRQVLINLRVAVGRDLI